MHNMRIRLSLFKQREDFVYYIIMLCNRALLHFVKLQLAHISLQVQL